MLFQPGVEAAQVAAEAARNAAYFAFGGTVVTALVGVLVAYLNIRAARRTQRELQELKQSSDAQLAYLNAAIRKEQAEQDARRDYLYEARKRLYKECGPILFRLAEASENALHRIYSLARTARNGDLDPPNSWLSGPGYYLTSTLYNLLIPCAAFRLLQERLTLVDLEVDSRIKDQYLLAKWAYVSFTDDFSLAHIEPALPYSPFAPVGRTRRAAEPAQYWRQGVPLGRLDAAIDGLITAGANGVSRLLTYGEFETALAADLAGTGMRYGILADVFDHFHPRTRPILWRILIVQALLHRELIRIFRSRGSSTRPIELLARVPADESDRLFWPSVKNPVTESEASQPYSVASRYFQTHLPVLFDALREPASRPGDGP
ncbi:MAG: hypothetical protein M3416_09710 [Acidobacteriota bacterium]|nr:hypothetical protein [Acidobacteriota bacterium]